MILKQNSLAFEFNNRFLLVSRKWVYCKSINSFETSFR
jgi:hypothetical protein